MDKIEQELRSVIQATKAEGFEGIERIEVTVEPQTSYAFKLVIFPQD